MAECIVGDIAPSDNVSKEEKHRREEASELHVQQLLGGAKIKKKLMLLLLSQEAMRHLSSLLAEGLKQEIFALWEVVLIFDYKV